MAKRTLLDMVQTILSDMVAGQVNSISDTEEAMAVATIIKRTYFDLLVDHNLPTRRKMIVLESLQDVDRPTTFKIPDSVYELEWIKYDYRTGPADTQIRYTEVTYLPPEEFFNRNSLYNSTDNYITVTQDPSGVKLLIRNDVNPTYWTSFDNVHVVMDGYKQELEATLQSSKVAAYGTSGASWNMNDSFVPDLPDHLFPLLLSTSENRAFEFLKQTMSINVDKQERRSRRRYDRHKNRVERSIDKTNFGR